MAKYVLCGQAQCDEYAKAELLADDLSMNLPDFKVHKIVLSNDDYDIWLKDICERNGWTHSKSPLIYRELVDRGGRGLYLGDFKSLEEMANHWYGFKSKLDSSTAEAVAKENLERYAANKKDNIKEPPIPVKICILGAASPLAYQLIPMFFGGCFGGKLISFTFYDTEDKLSILKGIEMELEDMAVDDYYSVTITNNMTSSVSDADYVIILEDIPATEYTECFSLLRDVNDFYKSVADAIRGAISDKTKIIINGYKACIGALLLKHYDVTNENITTVTGLDEQRVRSKLAKQLAILPHEVRHIIVWGNVPLTETAKTTLGQVRNHLGSLSGPSFFYKPVSKAVVSTTWDEDNEDDRLSRDKKIQILTGRDPQMSSALAIYRHISVLANGSDFFTMGVELKGQFGTEHGITMSVPVEVSSSGQVTVLDSLELTEDMKNNILLQNNQLLVEKQVALSEHQDLQTVLRHLEDALWRVVEIPSLARELEEKEVLRLAAEEERRKAAERQAIEEEKRRQEEEALRQAEEKAAALLAQEQMEKEDHEDEYEEEGDEAEEEH